MNGDPRGLEMGSSQPLPPAYTQGPLGQRGTSPGDMRPQPPFYAGTGSAGAPASVAPMMAPVASAAGTGGPASEPAPPPAPLAPYQRPASAPQTIASGTIPADAIYMPDAEIPKRAAREEEVADFGGPSRRPLTTTDATILVAARLELLARGLRERGGAALQAGYGGDPLDAALSGLISGYIAGRAR